MMYTFLSSLTYLLNIYTSVYPTSLQTGNNLEERKMAMILDSAIWVLISARMLPVCML